MMENTKMKIARKKLTDLKNWYMLIVLFSVSSIAMFWLSFYIQRLNTPEFVSWIYRLIPLIWLMITVLQRFNMENKLPKPLKKWEERQIRKFMEEDKRESEKYR